VSETLQISGLQLEVRRSTRRTTLGLTVDRGGELIVHAPLDTSCDDLVGWTRTKLLWVHRKLAMKRELEAKVLSPEYVTGESFSYLGRRYRLRVVAYQDEPLLFDHDGFTLRADAKASAPEHFRRWYSRTGTGWVQERAHALAQRAGAAAIKLEVRDLGFRWGSCTARGKVLINWKLLQLPVRLADYVIMHELAHLIERRHGPEFQALLSRVMPDWEQRHEDLTRRAAEIYWCHPGMTD
jgi:predicted metal-dependent hydrolase